MKKLRSILASLNGWKRMWLLGSLLGFLGVAVCAAYTFPTVDRQKSIAYGEWGKAVTDISSQGKADMDECFRLMRSGQYAMFHTCSRAATERETYRRKLADERQNEAQSEVESKYLSVQALWIAKVVGAWAASIGTVFLLGLSIAWVRRGFQRAV